MLNPYYKKQNFELYNGDCLTLLGQFPKNSVDMIFADPPYFLSNGTFTCHNGRKVSVKKGDWDMCNSLKESFEFYLKWIELCKSLLKPNGTIWISGTYHSIYQCGLALQINKYHIINDISWLKPHPSPNLSHRSFTASHETLIWAKKGKKAKHTFNYNNMVNWENNHKQTFICENCNEKNKHEIINKIGKQMKSVWLIDTPQKQEKVFGKHPTQKPAELLKRIIVASTNKNDVILDPFAGSSTSGLAAYLYNRKFIGIDMEKKFLNLSIKRFESLKRNMNNFSST